jgi:hypothetical protein
MFCTVTVLASGRVVPCVQLGSTHTPLINVAFDTLSTVNSLVGAAACVTETVRTKLPPVTVTVPDREAPVLLAAALILNEPLPLRCVTLLTVSHDVALLVGMFHSPLAVTFTVTFCAMAVGAHADLSSVSVAFVPACRTVIVRSI